MTENLLTNDFLSKENTANIYKQITINNELNNLTKIQKDKIISQLIDTMKRVFKTLDLNKINKTNIIMVKKQYNDIVIKQTSELIKSINKPTENNKLNERTFESIKRPLPNPGNDRPSAGNTFGAAPSASADFMKRATQDVNTRLSELENSRRVGNERTTQPEIPDFLKPIKVGKVNTFDTPPSFTNEPSKPLLNGFNNDDDSNFSSSVPSSDISKYNETLSVQDRLKQLEMERSNQPSLVSPNAPTPTNINTHVSNQSSNMSTLNQHQSSNMSNINQPQPSNMSTLNQHQPSNKLNELLYKINEMQGLVNNLKQENEYLKSQLNTSSLQKKQSSKLFQLEVNKKDASYNFQFNPINNIISIKLASYNLPLPIYNIIEDSVFKYKINDNIKHIYIPKGNYNIDILLNTLNKNNDIIVSLDISQKINIKSKEDNINFELIPNNFMNKLGFVQSEYNYVNYLIANKIYDLRPPSKLLFYIKNIYQDQPVGILNFNGSSVCDIQFNKLVTLNNLLLEFYTEDNILYNFNEIMYNLSFIIELIDN
jgi:hypothetical protein